MKPLRAVAPSLLLAALVLTGCSDDAGSTDAMSGEAPAEAAGGADTRAEQGESADGLAYDADASRSVKGAASQSTNEPAAPRSPAVISTGSITIESKDVAKARFDLGKVVDTLGGTIADEKTTASSGGDVRLSRLVLRIPSEEFDRAMTDLAGLGEVTAATRKAEDVTTEVIDTEARIRAQEQSLERVEVLLARAQSIRDIVNIESQLTRRQATLDSLKSQLAWLEDQTSLATLTVYLEAAPEPKPAAKADDEDRTAFLAGLSGGWDALTALGGGLARVAGALLPFAVAGLVLGLPLWVGLRRWLARHPLRPPAPQG
jgi:hypothetical protein